MRISYWGSDVCSSDLCPGGRGLRQARHGWRAPESGQDVLPREKRPPADRTRRPTGARTVNLVAHPADRRKAKKKRPDKRRVGEESVSKCRYRGWPKHSKKKTTEGKTKSR